MPEIVQEIGAYAGLASVLGLAVLSALYFSQARDVKRLREWAGRAPERVPGQPQSQPQRVVAQPQRAGQAQARPGAPPVPGQQQRPGAPAVPGQQRPGVPAAAAAAGARPAASTPAAQAAGGATAAQATNAGAAQAPAKPGPGGDDKLVAGQEASAQGAAAGQEGTAQGAAAGANESGTNAKGGNGQGANAQGAAATAASAPTQVVPGRAATPAGSRPGAPVVPAGRTQASGARLPNRPAPPRTVQPPPEPEQAPWYRTPRYVVLALVGVLVVGGGAAAAVTQLGGDDQTGGGGEQAAQQASGNGGDDGGTQERKPPVNPADVTVAVLNGTTVPGLAAQVSDKLQQRGFNVGNVDNSPDSSQQRAESVIQFAGGHRREAVAVGRRLSIGQREPIDPAVQQLAGDATVVVIAGQDQDSTP